MRRMTKYWPRSVRWLAVLVLMLWFGIVSVSHGSNLYGAGSSYLYTIDTTTAARTNVGPLATTGDYIQGLSFDSDGTLYGAGSSYLYTIDTTTAARTNVGPLATTGDYIQGLSFDSDGTLYGAGSSYLYTIDTTTAARTNVGPLGATDSIRALASAGATIPEPTTFALALAALCLAIGRRPL